MKNTLEQWEEIQLLLIAKDFDHSTIVAQRAVYFNGVTALFNLVNDCFKEDGDGYGGADLDKFANMMAQTSYVIDGHYKNLHEFLDNPDNS